ncbi:hypothetical protein BC567DRAFT_235975 [Phyllosticta citribraziliensis]
MVSKSLVTVYPASASTCLLITARGHVGHASVQMLCHPMVCWVLGFAPAVLGMVFCVGARGGPSPSGNESTRHKSRPPPLAAFAVWTGHYFVQNCIMTSVVPEDSQALCRTRRVRRRRHMPTS